MKRLSKRVELLEAQTEAQAVREDEKDRRCFFYLRVHALMQAWVRTNGKYDTIPTEEEITKARVTAKKDIQTGRFDIEHFAAGVDRATEDAALHCYFRWMDGYFGFPGPDKPTGIETSDPAWADVVEALGLRPEDNEPVTITSPEFRRLPAWVEQTEADGRWREILEG